MPETAIGNRLRLAVRQDNVLWCLVNGVLYSFRNKKFIKETTGIVIAGIKAGKSLEQLQQQKALAKYDKLGSGGAQTTDQYLGMLYKLLLK